MDPRERAEAALARARARGAFVVTPDDAVSPMDAKNTLQIPRSLILAAAHCDDDPEATMVVPASSATSMIGDDRTRSMPAPVPPHIRQQEAMAYAEDNPLTRPSSTQPLVRSQQHARWPEPETVHEEQDGLLPTTTTVTRRSLSQRLDGE